ncbi:MAG: ferritin family protein [bacterium]
MEILADGLRKAAMAELEGHNFYLMAAATTKDQKGKEVLMLLAREEMDHFKFLKTHYESVQETGKLSETAKLGARGDFDEAWPIFSTELKGRAGEAHYEMTALSIGIQLEQDAMKFYKELSQKVADPKAQSFFEELAEWEKGHYHALLNQQEALKHDYWEGAGFEPF